jgi:superfamily II RNA helicase
MFGVAIHHGAPPGPFRREIERLPQLGSLKVTIASPTLAQGLNLSASAVLFHGLRRGRDLLKGAEFANVIGRAGRAFVDTEGLVLYPIFQPTETRRREWLELTQGDGGKGSAVGTHRGRRRAPAKDVRIAQVRFYRALPRLPHQRPGLVSAHRVPRARR